MFFGRLSFEGQGAIEERPLFSAVTSLGRAPENDVWLEDPTVSRFHARIQCDEGGCRIMDLGSGNGTRVDGVELEVKVEYPLADRALVQIGPFSIRYLAPVVKGAEAGERETKGPEAGARPSAGQLGQTVVVPLPVPPRLVVATPQGVKEFPLTGATMTLGRDPANDIVVDYDAVSRRHARLDRRDTGWEITDLGSTNGLRLLDQQVQHAALANGDVVYVGRTVTLEFRDPQAARVGAVLRGEPSERRSASFDLPAKGPLILGRSENADVTVFHPQVQRAHAQIEQRAGGTYLEDLGSSAGTYVNGQLIKEHRLAEGDVVRIGSSRLVLEQGRLRLVDEAGDLRLDAFHLSRVVGKGLPILQDVSLSIYPQEFVAIVGGSGAGKSTLLNALSGYRPANSGTVLLNGVDLYRNFNAYRNDLGYVPQDDLIHRELPVRRSLDYAAQLRMPADTSAAERRQRIEEVIDELDLRVAADRAVRALSGGQRKRVSIGVELLTRPSLFFLDEATSGLDPGTETQMMKLLRRLADQGRTVALVTHATKNVMVCDKVVFMARGGRLAYYGPPEDALRYFQVDDFDEIYNRMEQTDPTESEVRYRRSPQFQQHVVKRLTEAQALATSGDTGDPLSLPSAVPSAAAPGARGPAGARPGTAPSAPRQMSSWRQFVVLTKRYLDTIWSDKKSAALLLAIAPILGALDFIQWKRHTFDLVQGSASQAVTMFFMTGILCVLVGCITSVREIVKEDAVYRRERMVGLRVLPYVGSKVAVGLALAVYCGVSYFIFKLLAVDFSFLSAVEILQLFVPIIIAMFAGVMWGLLVSALAPSEDRAMLLIILVCVPQFVFSGGMIPMSDLGTAGKVLGAIMSTRWALGALVTSAEVESGPRLEADLSDTYMPGSEGFATLAEKQAMINSLHDQYGEIFHINVAYYWGMAAVICLALLAAVVFLQKRKDTL
ncbi:MAG: FHA domain-containing protein [Gaiellales bacterium]|nr:FHA domain-containing protein [Gaiellales bacterium]